MALVRIPLAARKTSGVAPNGDIFVADGHGGASNSRIVKFSRDGRFLRTWGRRGSAPGEFDFPHSLAMDSRGRLFVADLNNLRIQAFTQDGEFLFEWKELGMPGGVAIDGRNRLYVADSLSGTDRHPGWVRGIRIGSVTDGNVVGAVVPARMVQKHVRR